jgi:hypothetical protein
MPMFEETAGVEPPSSPQERAPAALPGEAMVSLDLERARVEQALQQSLGAHIPLAVAAASAIHLVSRNAHEIISRREYDDALDVAAAAISRLVPVYASAVPRPCEAAISIDISKERFGNGAAELRGADGRKISPLFIRRSDMLSALSLIKRTGLLFV